jgi:hypothetical protein
VKMSVRRLACRCGEAIAPADFAAAPAPFASGEPPSFPESLMLGARIRRGEGGSSPESAKLGGGWGGRRSVARGRANREDGPGRYGSGGGVESRGELGDEGGIVEAGSGKGGRTHASRVAAAKKGWETRRRRQAEA